MLLARKGWLAGLIGAALVLGGCASSDDEAEVVAPLPEIANPIDASVQWTARVGNGIEDYWSSLSPAVAYDKVFVSERFGLISAFDQATGEQVWETNLRRVFAEGALQKNKGARLSGGLTTGFNKVFVGSENGVLFALNAEDGVVVWQATTRGEVLSDPEVVGTNVIVNTGAGKVQAFDVDSGEFEWQMDLTMPSLVLRGTSGIGQAQGAALVGTPDGKITAIIAENGAPVWEARLGEATGANELERVVDVDAAPVVLGDTVYGVAFNGNLSAIELRSGRILWARQYSSYSPLAISGFDIYLTDAKGSVFAIDRRNGLEKWANSELTGRMVTAPQVLGDYLVVGDFEGYLHIIDRDNGTLLGRVQVDSSGLYTQALRDGDTLYLQTRAGRIAAVTIP
ncbi:outer membrane protein assembly factor BamB [Ferrimonas balearica]|uniref:outer membrane protein assembly factor BamB n=1 Tax=Ferrimonas balearica TaxID=44012 RepID=UPI001C942451|nr:outer membrane protein assembly factor BamB [Ferrimonas balearica]MBY6106833.1 outer membrane protein assembly factor BamB [Ferrimonas balearica]